ncbi:hypothetical protein C8T65DRAFT_743400 [Cerioporus squamosus]|nr:hypothetical protein C8T65DRAFT_743400 [Cerioporus squamosus]
MPLAIPAAMTIAKIVGGVALIGVSAPVIAATGAAVALPAIGFTSGGVAAGSIAAGAQSVFYGAFTCGLFSSLQAAGATVAVPGILSFAGAVGGAVLGGRLMSM